MKKRVLPRSGKQLLMKVIETMKLVQLWWLEADSAHLLYEEVPDNLREAGTRRHKKRVCNYSLSQSG